MLLSARGGGLRARGNADYIEYRFCIKIWAILLVHLLLAPIIQQTYSVWVLHKNSSNIKKATNFTIE